MNSPTINFDVVKAILICVVVLDHNNYIRELFPDFFRCLNFHVVGFLSLPFLRTPRPLSKKFVIDRMTRYLVPFLFFSTFAFILYAKYNPGQATLIENLGIYLWGVITGNSDLLKQTTGFAMFWFLPALLGMVLMRSFLFSLNDFLKYLLMCLFIGLHFVIGLTPEYYFKLMPLGLPVVIYVYLLGMLIALFAKKMNLPLMLMWSGVFIISTYYSIDLKTATEVGFVKVEGINNLNILFLHDLMAISGVLCVIFVSAYIPDMILIKKIGENSLLIYLIHPFVYFLIKYIYQYLGIHFNIYISAVWLIFITYIVALMISLWCSLLVYKIPLLKKMIVPGYFNEWLPVKLLTSRS